MKQCGTRGFAEGGIGDVQIAILILHRGRCYQAASVVREVEIDAAARAEGWIGCAVGGGPR